MIVVVNNWIPFTFCRGVVVSTTTLNLRLDVLSSPSYHCFALLFPLLLAVVTSSSSSLMTVHCAFYRHLRARILSEKNGPGATEVLKMENHHSCKSVTSILFPLR